MLQRRGIPKTALKVGDVIVVEGFRRETARTTGRAEPVTFPDGRRVFTASAEDALPKSDK